MPAVSEKQRKMMAIAEHHPEKLYKKNRSVLSMSHKQLHDFASKKDSGFYGHMGVSGSVHIHGDGQRDCRI